MTGTKLKEFMRRLNVSVKYRDVYLNNQQMCYHKKSTVLRTNFGAGIFHEVSEGHYATAPFC